MMIKRVINSWRAAIGERANSMLQKDRTSIAEGLGGKHVRLAVMIQGGHGEV
jgi:hypothetical protein